MMNIVCANPFHARHEGEPGWCALLGHREGAESGTIQIGLFCSACARHVSAVRECLPLARKMSSSQLGLISGLAKAVGIPGDEVSFLINA